MGESVKKILLIDDDSSTEELLKTIFKDDGIQFEKLIEKKDILSQLKKFHAQYETIIVKKDFTGFDLQEFITDLREEPTTHFLPIIELVKEDDSSVEGLFASHEKCPNLFFMKFPLNPGLLIPLIKSIGIMYKEQRKYHQFTAKKKLILEKFSSLKCNITTLDEAKEMADHLALYFLDSNRAANGIYQLLENAIEHGNLGIGYENKSSFLKEGKWLEEIQTKIKDKENKRKTVEIVIERKKDGTYIQITDTGKGFDWKKYMDVDPSRANHQHGRGIPLVNKIYFDKLVYNQEGNQVTGFMSSKKKRATFWD